jgi:hypothetical protein
MPQTGHCSRALFRCSVIQSAPLETKMAGTVTFCPAKFVGVVPSRPDACGIRSTHLGAVGSEHEISSANFTTMHWRSCCGRQPDQIGAIQVGNQGGRTAPIGSGATLRSDTETRFVRSGKPVRALSASAALGTGSVSTAISSRGALLIECLLSEKMTAGLTIPALTQVNAKFLPAILAGRNSIKLLK